MKIYIFTLIIAGIIIDPLIADEDINIKNTLESLHLNEENLAPSLPRQKKSYAAIPQPRIGMKPSRNHRYTSIFVEPSEMKHYKYYKPPVVVQKTVSYNLVPVYSKPVYVPPPPHKSHAVEYSASTIQEEPDYKNSVYHVPVHEEEHYNIPAPKYSKPAYVAPPEEQHYNNLDPKYDEPSKSDYEETHYTSPVPVDNEPIYSDYSHTMPCGQSLLISCNPSVSRAPCGYKTSVYKTSDYHHSAPTYYSKAASYYVPSKVCHSPGKSYYVPVIKYRMSSHHNSAPDYSVASVSAVASSQPGNGDKNDK